MGKERKQTKSSFKFIGKVSRIDKDGAFKEDEAKKGKMEGTTYRSLRFGVKTSVNNEMTVQMYDFEPKEVFLWDNEKAKKAKEKKQQYKGDKMDFDDFLDQEEELREKGITSLQTRIGLTYGEDGKLQSHGVPSFIASERIYEGLENGDSVIVEGDIRYSEYEGQDGKMKKQTTFTIKKLYKIKDVNFESEKFSEVTYFEQEFVYVGAEEDRELKKVFVIGRTIDYKGNWFDSQFVVPYGDESAEDGIDEDMKKLADAFLKKMKFGDLLKVHGDALNRVITKEVEAEEENEEDALLKSLGGKSKPKHAQGYTAREYISEMQILGVEEWHKKEYSEDDFVKDDLVTDEEDKGLRDELGGKKKKSNPFASVDDEGDIDISDEDLPF